MALRRPEHISYLLSGLGSLSSNYSSLDASRPWLCYWILHSVETLGPSGQIPAEYAHHIVDFLRRCQHKLDGGFCGGPHPGQMAHLAPTYAAVSALLSNPTPNPNPNPDPTPNPDPNSTPTRTRTLLRSTPWSPWAPRRHTPRSTAPRCAASC